MSKIPALAAAAAVLALLAGCAADPATPRELATVLHVEHEPKASIQPAETLAVVGDSISAWAPAYRNDPGQTWVTTTSASIPLVGGWALPGATLGVMNANVTPAPSAYFVVAMGGTNDIFQNVPIAERIRLLDSIIDTVDARVVVVSTVAPYGFDPALGIAWNAELERFAANHGYAFIDPWAAVRASDGSWIPGASLPDTIHPTPATATLIGQSVKHSLDVLYHGWKELA